MELEEMIKNTTGQAQQHIETLEAQPFLVRMSYRSELKKAKQALGEFGKNPGDHSYGLQKGALDEISTNLGAAMEKLNKKYVTINSIYSKTDKIPLLGKWLGKKRENYMTRLEGINKNYHALEKTIKENIDAFSGNKKLPAHLKKDKQSVLAKGEEPKDKKSYAGGDLGQRLYMEQGEEAKMQTNYSKGQGDNYGAAGMIMGGVIGLAGLATGYGLVAAIGAAIFGYSAFKSGGTPESSSSSIHKMKRRYLTYSVAGA